MTTAGQASGPRAESALVIELPEVEPLVADIRLAHDPAAALGVPAHVTILFPFVPPARLEPPVLDVIESIAASRPIFDVRFERVAAFDTAIYLDPVPDTPFRALTRAVHEAFPGYPPYEGRFDDVIPHLTLAMGRPDEMTSLVDPIAESLAARLPIDVRVDALDLLVFDGTRWHREASWPLGGGQAS